MDSIELWNQFKEIFIDLVKYGLPTLAIVLSTLSYMDSRKANKVRGRLGEIEEKLRKYELEEKEIEREESTKACVEARIFKVSKNNYKMKVWNSGKATAYNIDFLVHGKVQDMISRDKVPYEFLDSGKNFEERVAVYFGTPNKLKVTTTWEDKDGVPDSKEQILSI